MFNFSANHLFLLSRTEYPSCAVFLLQDRDTKRVYRLYDFTKARVIRPNVAYCVAGKINNADKLYLVIESVRLDTKHRGFSDAPVLLMARKGPLSTTAAESRAPARPPARSNPGVDALVCSVVKTGHAAVVKAGENAAILNRG